MTLNAMVGETKAPPTAWLGRFCPHGRELKALWSHSWTFVPRFCIDNVTWERAFDGPLILIMLPGWFNGII